MCTCLPMPNFFYKFIFFSILFCLPCHLLFILLPLLIFCNFHPQKLDHILFFLLTLLNIFLHSLTIDQISEACVMAGLINGLFFYNIISVFLDNNLCLNWFNKPEYLYFLLASVNQ